ncbi:hypothetical protein RhiXN_03477 [Rhizoctonia solani]|uniref:Uncharacterized protein n=1 Tax=Rhizoctonia solani TaxID=456999 RepID=A0A8H8SVW1_9AGAM|nr:uncharacterized protein RhiXN_03477 [Rhizoctonia solani]QRW18553.1 hypothetical protein RhiXN_03477 [Rhizoctonia solani]
MFHRIGYNYMHLKAHNMLAHGLQSTSCFVPTISSLTLAYKSPTSFAQLSNHQVLVSDLVPEVSLKFVTQLSLELAVGKGLIQIKINNETHISNNSGALSTDQLSAEDKGNNKTVATLLFSNQCHSPDAHTGNNANNPEATNFPVE